MSTVTNLIHSIVNKAIELEIIPDRDKIFYCNRLHTLLNIILSHDENSAMVDKSLIELVDELYDQLSESDRDRIGLNKEQVTTRICGELIPPPSVINSKFEQLKTLHGIKYALEWFYQLSKDSDYIKIAAINKNQNWVSNTKYGELQLTINLSKPEKDPAEIARAKLLPSSDYPYCLLCIENEGYQGNANNHPARHNHRLLDFRLDSGNYYFQYSPYLYYPEHSIIINPQHRDMVINRATIENFISFCDQVPHYLIGSNSDIPIVGGSILTHDHYQAGNHIFPIEKSTVKHHFNLSQFPNLQIEHLNWPLTTLKLIGDADNVLSAFELIQQNWYQYNNEELDIISSSNGIRHNAITPIMRKISADKYVLYLLLRNNRTNGKYPDGIFHPHRELHHIKKENIGLIEAMGLAILPGRLATELDGIKKLLLLNHFDSGLEQIKFIPELHKHQNWLVEMYSRDEIFTMDYIDDILRQEVADKFAAVLEQCGVFKNNDNGNFALTQFMNSLTQH